MARTASGPWTRYPWGSASVRNTLKPFWAWSETKQRPFGAATVLRALKTRTLAKNPPPRHTRQGKTFTVRWQNGTPTITTAAGKIAPAELKSLKEEFMDNSDVHIFPDEEVAVGSEWTVDPKYLSKSFKGAERATMKAKLEEVAPFQGHPCARITLTIEMYGTFGGVPMLMELAGEMRHAIDIQHTTSIIMSGPVSMKMEKTENGIPLSIQGKGDFAGTWTRQYTKLGSKPASAQ